MRESRGSVGADKQQSIHHQLPPQRKCSAGACPQPTARPPVALVPPDSINREAVQQHQGKCPDLGVPAPYGHNIPPMRVCHRRGGLIEESQERVARAKSLPGDVGVSPTSPFSWPGEGGQVEDYARRGDEVEQLVELASVGWKSPLDRRMRSRVATRPFQFTCMQ